MNTSIFRITNLLWLFCMKGILILLLFRPFNCEAQEVVNGQNKEHISFIKHFGEQGNSRGVTVEELKEGGYILTGYTTDGDYGKEDVVLIKTTALGEIEWKKTYGGEGEDYGWAVRQTADGGYILTGYTNSFGHGGMDVYLIKTNLHGDTLWTKTFGGKGEEYGWDVRITKEGDYIIAGQTTSFGNGEIDAFLILVDAEGKEKWSNSYGGAMIDRIFSVQQTREGGFVAAGISYSFTSIGPDDRDGYIVKTDPDGKQEWFRTFGKDKYDVGHSIDLTRDDGYLITGYGESYSINGDRDVYLIKTDNQGITQWIKTYGGLLDERGIKGIQTKDGGYIAIGLTDNNIDMYLIKTDKYGDQLWSRTFGNIDKVDFGYTVKETRDGGYILIGHSSNADNEGAKILLVKTNGEGLVR